MVVSVKKGCLRSRNFATMTIVLSIGIKDSHKIMIPSYLNLFFEYASTISVYLWLSMARMETEYS